MQRLTNLAKLAILIYAATVCLCLLLTLLIPRESAIGSLIVSLVTTLRQAALAP